MKVRLEFPPNIDEIRAWYQVEGLNANMLNFALFAYGDTIYHPSGGPIEPALRAHEEVHSQQQGNNAEDWWYRYLREDKFRLEQEFEAHLIELHHRQAVAINRHQRRAIFDGMTKRLSAPLYGNMITTRGAKAALKRGYLYEPIQGDKVKLS